MDQKAIDEVKRPRGLKFPLTVNDIKFDIDIGVKSKDVLSTEKPGDMVAVRSCKKAHGDKTRLGILVGYVPIHGGARFNNETGILTFELKGSNPAIFIPELGEVVLGCESWWGVIESEKDLREITDNDIENVWYVRALKQLAEAEKKEE